MRQLILHGLLFQIVVYLAAAVLAVPVAARLGLGSVVGYLLAGVVIGPAALGIIHEPEAILHFSEFGVVLLLFLIGLELEPTRLWHLRRSIFGLGAAQVVATTLVLAVAFWFVSSGLGELAVVAFALSLSSTAMALQILSERGLRTSEAGSMGFAVLLFQDLAVIPVMALLPVFALEAAPGQGFNALALAKPVAAVALIVLAGRYAMRQAFRYIAQTGLREIFTAFALLLVAGIALLMQAAGLSMALGAFIAGVLLANSEYRQQLEMELEPFKGLLMGLFFIAVGMSVELGLLISEPVRIALLVVVLLAVKFAVLYALARTYKAGRHSALQFAGVMCQGGEFAFVVFDIAGRVDLLSADLARTLTLVVGLSMLCTPLVMRFADMKIRRSLAGSASAEADSIDERHPIILIGFGRFGQTIGRLLMANQFALTVIDNDPDQIELTRRFGNKVFYGDATRLDTLESAGAAQASLLIVASDSPSSINAIVDTVQEHWPDLPMIVRARNRSHAYDLLERGIEVFERETFLSSLNLGRQALMKLGFSEERADGAAALFRAHDEAVIRRLAPLRADSDLLVTEARRSRDDLAQLMQSELSEQREEQAHS